MIELEILGMLKYEKLISLQYAVESYTSTYNRELEKNQTNKQRTSKLYVTPESIICLYSGEINYLDNSKEGEHYYAAVVDFLESYYVIPITEKSFKKILKDDNNKPKIL